MNTPADDHVFLHELELNVRTELTQAETGRPEESLPVDEWLSDPADTERYEVTLRSLLVAVETLEDTSGQRTEAEGA